jgi:hypothetical protein
MNVCNTKLNKQNYILFLLNKTSAIKCGWNYLTCRLTSSVPKKIPTLASSFELVLAHSPKSSIL